MVNQEKKNSYTSSCSLYWFPHLSQYIVVFTPDHMHVHMQTHTHTHTHTHMTHSEELPICDSKKAWARLSPRTVAVSCHERC